MPFLNMRNHRKILVVDGALAFMGGINIGAENSARLSSPGRILSATCISVSRGRWCAMVMDAFARDWSFTTDETLDGDFWWPEMKPAGSAYARGLRSGPDADIYKLELILGAALTLAQNHVRIITPYFLPDQRLQFAIQQAGLRGVKVDIVIPRQSNQLIMEWAMRGHLRFFRHVRATIITTPPPFDHTKLCTVDGEWCADRQFQLGRAQLPAEFRIRPGSDGPDLDRRAGRPDRCAHRNRQNPHRRHAGRRTFVEKIAQCRGPADDAHL